MGGACRGPIKPLRVRVDVKEISEEIWLSARSVTVGFSVHGKLVMYTKARNSMGRDMMLIHLGTIVCVYIAPVHGPPIQRNGLAPIRHLLHRVNRAIQGRAE